LREQKLELTAEVKAVMTACIQEFSRSRVRMEDGDQAGFNRGQEAVKQNRECIVQKAGEDIVKDFEAGNPPTGENQTKLQRAMQECAKASQMNEFEGRPEDYQKPPSESYQKPPEIYQKPAEQETQSPPQGSFEKPPLTGTYTGPSPLILEFCKKQVLGEGGQEFTPELQQKLEACIQSKTGEVRGASTSRLPAFIRWILGR
jgi:hypothetical protein